MVVLNLFLRLFHFMYTVRMFITEFHQYLAYPFAKLMPPKVEKDSECLRKVPVHIGAVIIEDDMSYTEISNLIVWSVLMGITYISIYDHSGNVKRNKNILLQTLRSQKEKIIGEDTDKYDIHLHQSGCIEKRNLGYPDKNRVDVMLVGAEDGKRSLVNMAKKFSVSLHEYQRNDITPCLVDTLLQEQNGFPDPDLILKFGKVDSLVGFLPWQMRLAEILSLPSHRGFSYNQFICALQSFGNIEMRFGK